MKEKCAISEMRTFLLHFETNSEFKAPRVKQGRRESSVVCLFFLLEDAIQVWYNNRTTFSLEEDFGVCMQCVCM